MDLFEKDQRHYLVVVDYYSIYITVHELVDTTNAASIVHELEHLFCMVGIPNSIVSDNGTQFMSDRFKQFVRKWDIQHITSAPK